MSHFEGTEPAEVLGPLADSLAATSLSLARRFAAGGTMWCLAPTWTAHARHVAVEFVHPVIVGKRALPAAVVDAVRAIDELRVLSRPGDVLLAIASADEVTVASAMRRAEAWGLTTVWIGAGTRPTQAAANHLLFVDGDGTDAYSGRLVLLYHLLWELTHVCFEHPGLLNEVDCEDDGSCMTCSDEGRLAEVLFVGSDQMAEVMTARGRESVDLALVDSARPGDLLLVHAGCAVALVEGVAR